MRSDKHFCSPTFSKELGEWWKPEVKTDEKRMKYIDYKISWKQPEYNNLISGDAGKVDSNFDWNYTILWLTILEVWAKPTG